MYMFRAINEKDFNNIKQEKTIWASALEQKRTVSLSLMSALDTLIGHLNGKTLEKEESFWISSSKILELVTTEYAIPQNGKYNTFHGRKPVVVIKGKEHQGNASRMIKNNQDYFYDNIDKSIRYNADYSYLCLDLSNRFLGELIENKIIFPSTMRQVEYHKEDMHGIIGFASKPKEVLHFVKIPDSMIRGVLTPLACDILYPFMGLDDDNLIEQFLNDIEDEHSKVKTAIERSFSNFNEQEMFVFQECFHDTSSYKMDFTKEYSDYTKNLDQIARDNYKKYNTPFIEFYIRLKQIKKDILNKIYQELVNLDYFNQEQLNKLKNICKNIPLVDDQIYVLSLASNKVEPPLAYSNLESRTNELINKKFLHDLIMLEDWDGNIINSPISTETFTKILKK